jgi:hypothetical protein
LDSKISRILGPPGQLNVALRRPVDIIASRSKTRV